VTVTTRHQTVRLLLSGGLFLTLLVATVAAFSPGGLEGTAIAAVTFSRDGSKAESGSAVERGKTLFLAKGCVACHAIGVNDPAFRPIIQAGPNLSNLPAIASTRRPGMSAPAYVWESIVEPQAYIVPGYYGSNTSPDRPIMPRMAISPEDVDALTTFLLAPR